MAYGQREQFMTHGPWEIYNFVKQCHTIHVPSWGINSPRPMDHTTLYNVISPMGHGKIIAERCGYYIAQMWKSGLPRSNGSSRRPVEMQRLPGNFGSLFSNHPIWQVPFMTRKSDVSSLSFTHNTCYSGDGRSSSDVGDAPHLVGAGYL